MENQNKSVPCLAIRSAAFTKGGQCYSDEDWDLRYFLHVPARLRFKDILGQEDGVLFENIHPLSNSLHRYMVLWGKSIESLQQLIMNVVDKDGWVLLQLDEGIVDKIPGPKGQVVEAAVINGFAVDVELAP